MSRAQTKPHRESVDGVMGYEVRLDQNRRWALDEASRYFMGQGGVRNALERIARKLDELSIPYAVAGGLALFQHGYRRFTEVIDILVNQDGLRAIHERLDGLGYVPPFAGSKNLKDTEDGVRIEFLITGDFPGDGKPKPVAFPDPASVAVDIDGIKYLNLPTLVEMKLASGMTNPRRGQDLIDVQNLVEHLSLPLEFGNQLNEYVGEKYREIWRTLNPTD